MTEQIKSAIADFQEWIDRAEKFNPDIESDHVKAMKLAIRSLQAWEEVLQELEELKQEFKNDRRIHEAIAVNISIKRIKEKLEQIKKIGEEYE